MRLIPRVPVVSSAGVLESALDLPSGEDAPRAAAVCCHPHPLMGGTMRNPVIVRAARVLVQAGCAALRFNFRGVGGSAGNHGGGEPEGEDVAAALDACAAAWPGVPLVVLGYSFGAAIGARVAGADPRVRAVVLFGFPLSRGYALPAMGDRPVLAIQGERDAFGRPADLHAALARANPGLRVVAVPGADHLFVGKTVEAADALRDHLDLVLPRAPTS